MPEQIVLAEDWTDVNGIRRFYDLRVAIPCFLVIAPHGKQRTCFIHAGLFHFHRRAGVDFNQMSNWI